MASAPSLSHSHIFGLKSSIRSNLHFIDDNNVLYPAGHAIVIYNTETRTQKFIFGTEGAIITSLALSPNRKFVAVAEKGEKAVITVYDVHTHRKKVEMKSKQISEFVFVCFSPDGDNVLSLGNAPNYVMTNWLWEKKNPVQSVRVSESFQRSEDNEQESEIFTRSVKECSFCINDSTLIAAVGDGIIALYRIEDDEMKSVNIKWSNTYQHNFTCHAWMGNMLALGTKQAQLFLLLLDEFHSCVELPETHPNTSLYSMVSFANGIAIGTNSCEILLFDIMSKKDGEEFKLSTPKTLKARPHTKILGGGDSGGEITNLAISPSQEVLAMTTSHAETFVVDIANSDILKAEEMKLEPLLDLFHFQSITGLDLCLRKPLLVTCSTDKSVRVWNYYEMNCQSVKFFDEMPLSVAFHPSGFHIRFCSGGIF